MHPKDISISGFTYDLPAEKIASHPPAERDASKLLLYKNGVIKEDVYRNISRHVPEHALLLFNNSKVIEARLLFQKASSAFIEIFCLEPHEKYADITTAMQQHGKVIWECLIGGASKWKRGQVLKKEINVAGKVIILNAAYIEKRINNFIIEFSWHPPRLSFAEVLHTAGVIPLPPYIKRKVEESDAERYQTIYAQFDGSVAAPTAGLHFTESIFENLEAKNIQADFVTLHVGAGTFKPVKSETMEQHEMHAEYIDVSKETISTILRNLDGTIIPAGTTSLRTLESLYWLGVKTILSPGLKTLLPLSQWEAYELAEKNIPAAAALESLLEWMNKNNMERLITKTQILIAPGYTFKIAKALITNFHQPQSTLLLLVAAFIGDDWRKVYDHALRNDFRFLSYGDGSLLWAH
jgi:S-adenosylmethionine:tRNA ribosyltransferase-isomerase